MNLRKVVMVEPKSPGHNVYSYVQLPRLGLPILGTLAAREGLEVRIYLEEATQVDFADLASADLVCLSTITSTAPAAYRLADRVRAAGVPVVIGGPHVTFLPEEALSHADWVLRGEGEKSFPLFLRYLRAGGDPDDVPGLSWIEGGRVRHSPALPEPADMDADVPIPDFTLMAGRGRDRFNRGVIPIQTSRGCPHHCRFCSVTPMFGRKMRHASVEHVAEELAGWRGKGRQVFVYDDNFCAPPSRAKRLLDHLLSRGTFFPKPMAQVSVKAADDLELLGLMRRAGFDRVFVGFESIEPGALALYKKRQAVDDIRRAVRRFHRFGIKVHGMFVFGSDAEEPACMRDTTRFALDEGIDSIQFLILTPLPGTPLYDQMSREGRLLSADWSLYDTHHAVFRPAKMTAFELMTETFHAMGQFYSVRQNLKRLLARKLDQAVVGWYARGQVERWWRDNRALLERARRDPMGLHPLWSPALARS